MHLMARQFAQD
jgi:hypothetical protein